ncbi:hypothetical protein E8E12_000550 [Didymella heteroderae]|uniref:Uncharacterized protein n=1 Tax=Didymella heteroderae TaxID=1769908 RepID=A0A9P4WFH3_9PLEO|nr:hypothetical protein E8E12_000550 [Didymella heteroderae]
MQFSTIALLFAATVLGAPTESLTASGLRMRGEVDQGEGFYLAVFNNETGVADVEFTPLSELVTIAPVEEATSTVDERSLLKRATVCSGRRSINLGQLDDANRQLASNANAQGWYNKGANGWVHLGGETSFFCNYQGNYLTYQLIIDMHTVVSHYCGQDGYGHDRRTNGGGANDLAVGRTWRGDHFC